MSQSVGGQWKVTWKGDFLSTVIQGSSILLLAALPTSMTHRLPLDSLPPARNQAMRAWRRHTVSSSPPPWGCILGARSGSVTCGFSLILPTKNQYRAHLSIGRLTKMNAYIEYLQAYPEKITESIKPNKKNNLKKKNTWITEKNVNLCIGLKKSYKILK